MILEKQFIKIKQGSAILYSISLTVADLVERTCIEHYNSLTGEGYQRPLIPAHYRKIAKYLESSGSPTLPTAILTAVNPKQITEIRKIINENTLADVNKKNDLNVTYPLEVNDFFRVVIDGNLRVVDGQHRIEGIKYLKEINLEAYKRICDYQFPVLLMVITDDEKELEINAFININKAGKPVSTDLAVELRDKLRRKNLFETQEFLNESVATRVTQELNKLTDSPWNDLIRFGDDENAKGKSISINAFHQSIIDVIRSFVAANELIIVSDEGINDLIMDITLLLKDVWQLVAKKWKECFRNDKLTNIKLYNIQKGIGVFSLHHVLAEVVLEKKSHIEIIVEFNNILKVSNVISKNWNIGGDFSIFNSKSGFRHIAECIKNKI